MRPTQGRLSKSLISINVHFRLFMWHFHLTLDTIALCGIQGSFIQLESLGTAQYKIGPCHRTVFAVKFHQKKRM
jgi:hypothetical protein